MSRLALLVFGTAGLLAAQAKYQDATAFPEERAADIISRMSLKEKVRQMQNSAPAISRLGIPAYDWWNEGLHGVARAGLGTVFPQAIGLAATWDSGLEFRIADAISTEARAKYNAIGQNQDHARYHGLTFWSPNINIFRDPRWGRGQETFGEDPYLTLRFAVAFIKGMQGSDPHYFKTIATAKHFAVHSGPETGRHQFNVSPSGEDLDSTYLYAFRASVLEGGAGSVMCAYNRVAGEPACASGFLLQKKLRGDWHFPGYVVSDCGAVEDIQQGHRFTKTLAEAAALAVRAGTDLTCGREYEALPEAVEKGLIKESEIDTALQRLFVARFRLGMFDPRESVPFSRISMSAVESDEHKSLALEAAEKSMVLLKNQNGSLPLSNRLKRIAVMGPAADDPDALLGNYNGIPSEIVTPLQAIARRFSKQEVRYTLGAAYTAASIALIPKNVLGPGVRAEYFDNENLGGAPKLSRVEEHGYFRWDMNDPQVTAAIPREHFSLRWSAQLQVNRSGVYELGVERLPCPDCTGNDLARMYLDGKLLLEHNKHNEWDVSPLTKPVALKKGRVYELRVEYVQTGGAAGLELVWRPPAEAMLREAVDEARQADAVLLFLGLNSNLEGEESKIAIAGFAGGDRTSIDLPEPQEKLLKSVLSTGKPVTVVLVNGSALAINPAKDKAQSIVESWYAGQAGGTAIAAVLAGDYNPAGRLPVMFYKSVDQLPPFEDYSMKNRTYRYFTGAALYPFGYGLSYSDFQYSDLSVQKTDAGYRVAAHVTNRSDVDGDEVAQMYLRPATAGNWNCALRGFQRIHLEHGKSQMVEFILDEKELPDDAANLKVSIGGGQPLPQWTRFVEAGLK